MLTARSIGPLKSDDTKRDNRLNLIFYTRNSDALASVQTAVAGLTPRVRLEFYRNIETFSERLRKPSYESTLAVIVVADKDDLEDISSLRQLLWGMRTILVLPDGDDATIALAHSLRPRLVSKHGDDFEDLVAVLNKMIGDYNIKSKTQ